MTETETVGKFRKLEPAEVNKLVAETKKAEAEAQKAEFEAKLFEANIVEAKHRANTAAEEHKQYVLNTEAGRIQVHEAQRRELEVLAANQHHHVYAFNGGVSDSSANKCIDVLMGWHRNDPECDIQLNINSPGGDIIAGFSLFDTILDLRNSGHRVTTLATGYAASMGGVLLQAGDERVMGRNAFLLLHEGSLGASGDFGEVEDRVKFMEQLHDNILDIFADRSKLTKAFIRKNWKRRDWWLSATESEKLGLVDRIASVPPNNQALSKD